jgi:hypothetical protein
MSLRLLSTVSASGQHMAHSRGFERPNGGIVMCDHALWLQLLQISSNCKRWLVLV